MLWSFQAKKITNGKNFERASKRYFIPQEERKIGVFDKSKIYLCYLKQNNPRVERQRTLGSYLLSKQESIRQRSFSKNKNLLLKIKKCLPNGPILQTYRNQV